MANLLLVLSWAIFYSLHTALASAKLKRFLQANLPSFYNWYTLFYSILALVLFSGVVIQALFLPVESLFRPSQFGQYAGYMVAAAGVMIVLKSFREISIRSFFGLRSPSSPKVQPQLIDSGMYSQVRHPLYLGLLAIFLGYFLVAGTIGALIHLVCLILYLPIGIYFEEKNLLELFGEDYKTYQSDVPSLFPKIHKKRG